MLEPLFALARDLNERFPGSDDPYEIMTRLVEESGELAEQVHHFEGKERKIAKYGEPDKAKLAKEIKDVVRAAFQIALHYGIEQEVEESFQQSYQAIKS